MTNRGRPAAVDLVEVVRRFEPHIREVAKAITDGIWAEIPSYSALPDMDARREVEEAAAVNVTAFIRAVGQGKDIPKREIDALGEVGERRAHQGVPLEDVFSAFRLVGRVMWDHLSRELQGPPAAPMDVVTSLAGTVMRFTDQISSSVARHYSNAQRAIIRRQEAARREFLHDLLLGTYSSPDAMLDRATGFGYDLARPHIGVVASTETGTVDPAEAELTLTRALDRLAEHVSSLGQPLVDRRGGQTVGLFAISPGTEVKPAEIGEFLVKELGAGWSLGVGGPYAGLEGCRRSYLEAREALQIGSIIDPNQKVYAFESFLLYRFLRTDSDLVARFTEAVLGPIIDHDRKRRSELVKTLEAYLATDGSAKEAGRVLYAHPHTVTYRLKQIERLTGRSLKDPEDKLHMHLAAKALRLMQGSVSDESEGSDLRRSGGPRPLPPQVASVQ